MALLGINVKRRKHPNVLATPIATPASLDLDPGESGAVTVSGVDSLGRNVPVSIQNIPLVPGLLISRAGNVVTIKADPVGPEVDQDLVVNLEVV